MSRFKDIDMVKYDQEGGALAASEANRIAHVNLRNISVDPSLDD